jgi:hypothetical protein
MVDENKELSLLTNAITQILKVTECPNNCRDFIDALISVCSGNSHFEISDEQLARKGRTGGKSETTEARKKWANRGRAAIKTWQKAINFNFIEWKSGGKDWKNKVYMVTSYDMPLYSYASRVIDLAKKDSGWRNNANTAIERAAENLVGKLGIQPVKVTVKSKSATTVTRKFYKDAITHLSKAKDQIDKAKSIFEANDTGIYEDEVVDELEELVKWLRGRVDYYGSWLPARSEEEGTG